MGGERGAIVKDLAARVVEGFRPAMMDAASLLDSDLERAKCAMFVLAHVAAWSGVYFGRHHKVPAPNTPEGEAARITMTCAVLDLTKEIVNGEALKKLDAANPTPTSEQKDGRHG